MSRLTERIENFNKAYNIYVLAVNRYKQDDKDILNHMSLVQAFELVFEMARKVLKDYMDELGVKTWQTILFKAIRRFCCIMNSVARVYVNFCKKISNFYYLMFLE